MDLFTVTLNNIGGTILNYATFLAAVGTIVMALQEVAKNVVHWRISFNQTQFEKWLKGEKPLRKEFILLTTGGYESEEAFFDQPVEKMMGQIQAAANMALDFPVEYPHLYAFLTKIPGDSTDHDTWKAFAALSPPDAANLDTNQTNDVAKARARLGNLVARKLDAFQNETQYAWANANQRISVIAGSVLIAAILILSDYTKEFPAGWVFMWFLAIAGGVVAPFAKDVVSGLSGFSKPK